MKDRELDVWISSIFLGEHPSLTLVEDYWSHDYVYIDEEGTPMNTVGCFTEDEMLSMDVFKRMNTLVKDRDEWFQIEYSALGGTWSVHKERLVGYGWTVDGSNLARTVCQAAYKLIKDDTND